MEGDLLSTLLTLLHTDNTTWQREEAAGVGSKGLHSSWLRR